MQNLVQEDDRLLILNQTVIKHLFVLDIGVSMSSSFTIYSTAFMILGHIISINV